MKKVIRKVKETVVNNKKKVIAGAAVVGAGAAYLILKGKKKSVDEPDMEEPSEMFFEDVEYEDSDCDGGCYEDDASYEVEVISDEEEA